MNRGIMRATILACGLLACTLALVVSPATSDTKVDGEALKQAVEKDCRILRSFLALKRQHVIDALKLGAAEQANLLAEKIQLEEVRALRRIQWYLGTDKANKERVAKFGALVEKCKGLSVEDYLKRISDKGFKMPPWFEDPFNANLDEEGGDGPAKPCPSPAK